MLLAEVERGKQREGQDSCDDGGDAGTGDTEGGEAELPEHHRVAQRHVDHEAKNVADHDHVGPAYAGEI